MPVISLSESALDSVIQTLVDNHIIKHEDKDLSKDLCKDLIKKPTKRGTKRYTGVNLAFDPKPDITKCFARMWNGGWGHQQCNKYRKDTYEFCTGHLGLPSKKAGKRSDGTIGPCSICTDVMGESIVHKYSWEHATKYCEFDTNGDLCIIPQTLNGGYNQDSINPSDWPSEVIQNGNNISTQIQTSYTSSDTQPKSNDELDQDFVKEVDAYSLTLLQKVFNHLQQGKPPETLTEQEQMVYHTIDSCHLLNIDFSTYLQNRISSNMERDSIPEPTNSTESPPRPTIKHIKTENKYMVTKSPTRSISPVETVPSPPMETAPSPPPMETAPSPPPIETAPSPPPMETAPSPPPIETAPSPPPMETAPSPPMESAPSPPMETVPSPPPMESAPSPPMETVPSPPVETPQQKNVSVLFGSDTEDGDTEADDSEDDEEEEWAVKYFKITVGRKRALYGVTVDKKCYKLIPGTGTKGEYVGMYGEKACDPAFLDPIDPNPITDPKDWHL